ncbi:hypothetical protein OJ252_2590 [Cryptosporidium canis]|uniref:Uncharacterized protein n=1 Tax=Cryptosporidium canis TaxID=195482 RepID=A0ABQ8P4S0_9CRYT|nr:hypothetical protein OJ252_2590 [Cryptosporidium canis]
MVLSPRDRETEVVLLGDGQRVEVQVRKEVDQGKGDSDEEVLERIRNVGSCSSAASSNFFHSYRRIKQIEEERLRKMEEDYLEEKERSEFSKQREARIMSYMDSTSRKSEKRKKKKMKRGVKKQGKQTD